MKRNFQTWHSQAFSLFRRGKNFYNTPMTEQREWIEFCSKLEDIIPEKSNEEN